MAKSVHEVRDPIHTFIHYSPFERLVIDSAPVQRLRHIHQLALTYLLYPGATHKRFEHSLGVMELAGRVFDVITNRESLSASTEDLRVTLPELFDAEALTYWKQVVRLAALLHDTGHLPFSHAAEHALLPEGVSHETLSRAVITSPEMQAIWSAHRPQINAEDVVKLAVGPDEASDLAFTTWEGLLFEIIGGDAFGVDRMDYLLRDSYHTGAAYGRFDHYRLIDSLRILPSTIADPDGEPVEPALGIEIGGLQSVEALLMARYFMYSQVYQHRLRLIYNIHLQEFLAEWLPGRMFPTDVDSHLERSDNEVLVGMYAAARKGDDSAHDAARRIVDRNHFRLLYQSSGGDGKDFLAFGNEVYAVAQQRYGDQALRRKHFDGARDRFTDFPVREHDGHTVSALAVSQVLKQIPEVRVDCIFVEPNLRDTAERWLRRFRSNA